MKLKNTKVPGELKWCRLYHCYQCGKIVVLAENEYPVLVCCNYYMEYVDLRLRYDDCTVSDWVTLGLFKR